MPLHWHVLECALPAHYIVNSGQEFVHCLVEKSGTGHQGKIVWGSKHCSKYVYVTRDEDCIKGAVVCEERVFTVLPKGYRCEFKGNDMEVTLIASTGEKWLDCYAIPNGQSIIVLSDKYKVVKNDELKLDTYLEHTVDINGIEYNNNTSAESEDGVKKTQEISGKSSVE